MKKKFLGPPLPILVRNWLFKDVIGIPTSAKITLLSLSFFSCLSLSLFLFLSLSLSLFLSLSLSLSLFLSLAISISLSLCFLRPFHLSSTWYFFKGGIELDFLHRLAIFLHGLQGSSSRPKSNNRNGFVLYMLLVAKDYIDFSLAFNNCTFWL